MFIRLEDCLIKETVEELFNLHLLLRIKKSKRKNSKRKTASASNFMFIYLRPFVKPFLRYLSNHFKLILFSHKDSKTVEAITEAINKLFEDNIFDAFVSLPSEKHSSYFDLNLFLNEQEGRMLSNCYAIDSYSDTWRRFKCSIIPMTLFDGNHKDNMLFLCEKFIDKVIL